MAVLKCSGLIDQGKNTSLRGENYQWIIDTLWLEEKIFWSGNSKSI